MLVRLFDIVISIMVLFVFWPLLLVIYIILIFHIKSPVFIQERVGKKERLFLLIKFRTMKVGTVGVATHLVNTDSVTYFGRILRKLKLDELPQLLNVIRGDMSLVGPRPCLPNQIDVINKRRKLNVFKVRPGITGLSQINDIDMSKPVVLAKTDSLMIENYNIKSYFKILYYTAIGKGIGDRIVEK